MEKEINKWTLKMIGSAIGIVCLDKENVDPNVCVERRMEEEREEGRGRKGRVDGREGGREEGGRKGRVEGRKGGERGWKEREGGREEGREGGREEGGRKGRLEGRKGEERKEREGGREEGGRKGRVEGRKGGERGWKDVHTHMVDARVNLTVSPPRTSKTRLGTIFMAPSTIGGLTSASTSWSPRVGVLELTSNTLHSMLQ